MSRRPRVPFVAQHADGECASACLRMVLASHGRVLDADELADVLPVSRRGNSALDILDAARRQGLDGRGVRVDAGAIGALRLPAILHVGRNHFVVLEACRDGIAHVLDPATGPTTLDEHELRARFGGIALELWPSAAFERRRRPPSTLSRYLRPLLHRRGSLAIVLGLSALLVAASLVPAITTKLVVDRWLAGSHVAWRLPLFLGAFGVALGQVLASVVRGVLLVRLRESVDRALMHGLLDRLFSLPYAFFQRRSVGDLVMRLGSVAQIREVLTGTALSTMLDGALALVYLAAVTWLSPVMALTAAGLAAAHIVLFLLTRARIREHARRHLDAEADLRGAQTRLLSGIEGLLASAAGPDAQRHVERGFGRVLERAHVRGLHVARVEGIASGLRILAPLVLLGLGADLVERGQLSLGTMLAAGQMAASFLVPMLALVTSAGAMQVLQGHVARLDEVHRCPPEPQGDARPDALCPIELHGVSVRYAVREPPVLQDLTLRIDAGRHVAIVGRSGSGKSTLARLLVGLLRPDTGTMRLGGIDVNACDLQAVRRRIGIVTQEPALFDMTIAQNIALGTPGASDDAVRRAATAACVHDDIEALPMGYDTMLRDGGSELSGGQRQRVALARALVREPELLVLDEATSALDAITERGVHEALAGLGCTVVTIAHRLSTVVNADEIHVVEDGRIVESGRHAELVWRGRHYPELLRAQLGGAEPKSSKPLSADPQRSVS